MKDGLLPSDKEERSDELEANMAEGSADSELELASRIAVSLWVADGPPAEAAATVASRVSRRSIGWVLHLSSFPGYFVFGRTRPLYVFNGCSETCL